MKGITIMQPKHVRFLTERQSAEYAGMTVTEFRRVCTVQPEERAQGRKLWDVWRLDKWLDGDGGKHELSHEDIISRL